jgi:hypothetical protein
MSQHIQDPRTGHMKGSVGAGRQQVPQPARAAGHAPPETPEGPGAAGPDLGRALASLRIPAPALLPGHYVLEVYPDPRGPLTFEDQPATLSVYGPVHAGRAQEWMDAFPADTDLLDMFAVDARDLDDALHGLGFAREPGEPVYVNDPDVTAEGYSDGSLRDLPGHAREAMLSVHADGLTMTTTATPSLPPTDAERIIVRTAVDDWFDRIDDANAAGAGAAAVWFNDKDRRWQVVERAGVQSVWVDKRFDYCRSFASEPGRIMLSLGSEALQALRIEGTDPRVLAWAIEASGPADAAELAAAADTLRALTVDQQLVHYASSAGQRSLGRRLREAVQRDR